MAQVCYRYGMMMKNCFKTKIVAVFVALAMLISQVAILQHSFDHLNDILVASQSSTDQTHQENDNNGNDTYHNKCNKCFAAQNFKNLLSSKPVYFQPALQQHEKTSENLYNAGTQPAFSAYSSRAPPSFYLI